MLPRVSRTFAICIRLLPRKLDHSVLISYLLCRIADTIEDTSNLAAGQKADFLGQFACALNDGGPSARFLQEAFDKPANDEEHLARDADRVLREFRRLPLGHQIAVRPWVQEMCEGMAEFTQRHGGSSAARTEALSSVAELDRYCYYVAGTVGHLLTGLFRHHGSGWSPGRCATLDALATSFGLGLQLTNIIKDVADDRQRGWIFVPQELCQLVGLDPAHLHDPAYRDAGHHVMALLIHKAQRHLSDALTYSVALPRRQYGVRLFCLSALYFAVQTLRLAEVEDRLLDPDHKVKISRSQVYRTLVMTRIVAPSNLLVAGHFRRLAGSDWSSHAHPTTDLKGGRP
jgi:farnesyl-diphosphate farnesyltransferase